MKLSKPTLLTLATLASCTLLPALAIAAGGGEHGGSDQQGLIAALDQGKVAGVVAILVFLTAFTILATKVWPTISKGLSDRENKIRDEIDAAEMARKQAKDALEQYQQSLAQARAEAQKEIDKARAQAQVISAELKAKADVELAAMREKAMRDIENAKKSAVADIYAHSTQLATTMAGKILRREVGAGDTERLLAESVAQLAGTRN